MIEVVGRLFKIAILLLVVAAVTTILITPTLSDDVPGLVHRNHGSVAMVVAIGLVEVAALIRSCCRREDDSSHELLTSNILELVCQRLC
jgi:nitrate reductase gamma subunit